MSDNDDWRSRLQSDTDRDKQQINDFFAGPGGMFVAVAGVIFVIYFLYVAIFGG